MNYKEEFTKCLNDLKNPKTIYKQIPNLLTVSRAIGIIPINIFYFMGNIPAALITCLLVFITDCFDGKIARKFNITSDFGAKLDALCDKLMFFGLSFPLLVNLPIIIPSLIMEALISTTNLIKYKQGYDVKTNFAGKVKTWLLSISLILGYASLYINYPNIILYTSIISTLLTQNIALIKYYNNHNKILKKDIPSYDKTISTLIEKEESKDKNLDMSYKFVYQSNEKVSEEKQIPVKEKPLMRVRKK